MLEQLKELIRMQKALDENILKEHGIKEYPLANMKIALITELGELMNEFPTRFKHWKKTAVDNREKGLIEFVDCLHFALSLEAHFNNLVFNLDDIEEYTNCSYEDIDFSLCEIGTFLLEDDTLCLLESLFNIANNLGFTWDEIYQAYKEKNQVNYERLANGY